MKQLLRKICVYLFNSKQTGWKEVILHDAAVLLMFFACTQILSIALLISMFLGVAPRENEEMLKDVLFFVVSFGTLIAVVYGCVLVLRLRDCWLAHKKLLNKAAKGRNDTSTMLFASFWQGVLDRVNRFRWWEHYLYLPFVPPILACAAACLFPTLAAVSVGLIVATYGYLHHIGEFSLDLELLTRWGGVFLIYTVGMYAIHTVELIGEAIRARIGLTESNSDEEDAGTTS